MESFKELGFKAGDNVRCVSSDCMNFYKKGDTFVLQDSKGGIRTLGRGLDGSCGEWELVENKFKVGDRVRAIPSSSAGKTWKEGVTVSKINGNYVWAKETGTFVDKCRVELIESTSKWTETKTETIIKAIIDGELSNGQSISVEHYKDSNVVSLTVGARFMHRHGNFFNKDSLQELIEVLTEIKDAM